MKKVIVIVVPSLICIVIIIFLVNTFLLRNNEKGALQVTASPSSKVYINDKLIGQTPLCKCNVSDMLKTGEYTIRLVPTTGSLNEFQEKITISKSVLTVVDRKFGPGATSEGSIITLSQLKSGEKASLLVVSTPTRAEVLVDNLSSGFTPVVIDKLTDSDHELLIRKSGYLDKKVRIRTPGGYKLLASVYLSVDEDGLSLTPSPTQVASPSASPTPIVSKIVISQTPTGFLRVRASNNVNAGEVGRVSPGQTFDILSEIDDWYQITLPSGVTGWVSSQYATKQ
ncbi:MAG: SH3 domain-containing protein [Candidatus Levybacteria bacterium]|nr:SH3 domain-containing protein [Candidatus Levybacteria bacterium]